MYFWCSLGIGISVDGCSFTSVMKCELLENRYTDFKLGPLSGSFKKCRSNMIEQKYGCIVVILLCT